MARMMQAACRERPMCGCTRCDKGGRVKRGVRRIQRAREKASSGRVVSEFTTVDPLPWLSEFEVWQSEEDDDWMPYSWWLEAQ